MREFVKAYEDSEANHNEDDATTFPHWGRDVTFFRPSEGQEILMVGMGGRGMSREKASTFIQMFLALGDDDTREYFIGLMQDRNAGFTLKGPGGLFDIWEGLVEEWSGKDSEKPSGSAKSRSRTGANSTGTTRKRASTSSRSRSTAS
jgi:hypothetical protein